MLYSARMPQGVFSALPLTPAPGGILSVAAMNYYGENELRWAGNSYGWDTEACPVRLTLADFCTNAGEGVIAEAFSDQLNSWPFGIVTVYECLTPGIKPEERQKIAVRQNEAATQKGLEAELWGGKIAQAANRSDVPYLNNGAAVDVGGGSAVSVEVGIAKLEQGLADCGLGLQGVIHLTRQAAQIAGSVGAIRRNPDGVLQTRLGTPVIAGVGYGPEVVPGKPAATATPVPAPRALGKHDDNQWGFATGPVVVHLGPSQFLGEHLDIKTNVLQTVAGRSAAVYWDSCCVVAVQMDTTP